MACAFQEKGQVSRELGVERVHAYAEHAQLV